MPVSALSSFPIVSSADSSRSQDVAMLATSPFPSSSANSPHHFLPVIPSPLSPRRRSAAVQRGLLVSPPSSQSPFLMNTQQSSPQHYQNGVETPTAQSQSQSHHTSLPFSQRPIKAIPPTAQRPDALRERRRDMFLKKIRQDRDDKRWGSRLEDMERLDYKSEKARWEAEQARLAPPITCYTEPELEEEEHQHSLEQLRQHQYFSRQQQLQQSYSEADAAFLQQESEELEALIAMMENQQMQSYRRRHYNEEGDGDEDVKSSLSSAFGNEDDEEYDSIFMDMIDEQSQQQQQQQQQQRMPEDDGEAMDMS